MTLERRLWILRVLRTWIDRADEIVHAREVALREEIALTLPAPPPVSFTKSAAKRSEIKIQKKLRRRRGISASAFSQRYGRLA